MNRWGAVATLAVETWRSSGPRTSDRLASLVEFYARSYGLSEDDTTEAGRQAFTRTQDGRAL